MMIVAVTVVMVAVFAVCFALHLAAYFELRRSLSSKYPDVWAAVVAEIGGRKGSPVQAFAWSGRHRSMNDPALSGAVMRFRGFAVGAALSMLAAPFAWMPVEALLSRIS